MADAAPENSTAPKWSDLTRRKRSLLVGQAFVTVVVAWGVLFGLYYLVPFDNRTAGESVVRLFIGIVGFIVVLAFQLHRVKNAELPMVRAIQSLGVAIAVFLVVFAALYLSLSQAADSSFSESLNHTGGLYLTITVFSTVGFDDITPETDLARAVVSVQMLLDLVVIGAVAKLILNAAKSGMDDDV